MITSEGPLRFGLAGTGFWAAITHAPALASTPGVEFASVWGRNPGKAAAIAAEHHVCVHHDFDAFLAEVDAVAFAVPPDVQAALAVRAAAVGKHLLLEKPIATSEAAADRLVNSVRDAGVASVVFFTSRFRPEVRAWLIDVTSRDGWSGGGAVWLGSALRQDSPFNTPWRNDKGALWDLAPHAISMLWASLGPVVAVTADRGLADITHLVLHHEAGLTSTVTVTLSVPEQAGRVELCVWGEPGWSAGPIETPDPVAALRVALAEVADNARSGRVDHPCDVRFGRDILRVIAQAERQLGASSR